MINNYNVLIEKEESAPSEGRLYAITREELAALELLRSTGAGLLEAAQVACAALRANAGEYERTMKCIEAGVEALALRERTCSLAEAGWSSIAARSGCRKGRILPCGKA